MNKQYYIIVNVVLPIIVGLVIYFAATKNLISRQISNFLPDGLWAYAFTSCIHIIWDRKVNFIWLTMLCSFFVAFELLQSFHFIKGTGDIKDIFIYFVFGLLSLTINQFLKPKSISKTKSK
ncbi:MAG: hypothetical protein KIS69_05770 [Bacteroidetes bacterium]|nr:hypothetical protein [Bacteroidota bacterium]